MYIKANRHLEQHLKKRDHETIGLWLEHRNYDNEPAFRDNEGEPESAFMKAIDMKRWKEALLLHRYRHTYPRMVLPEPATPEDWKSVLKNLYQEAFPTADLELRLPSNQDKRDFWAKQQEEHLHNYHVAHLNREVALIRHYLTSIPAHEIKKNESQIAEQFIPALIDTMGKDQALLFVLHHQPSGMKLHRPLLNQGANPNAYAVHPFSGRIKHQTLKMAVTRSDKTILKDLLKAGADPYWRFEQGDFFLSNACQVIPHFDLESSKLGKNIQTHYARRIAIIDSFTSVMDASVIEQAYRFTAMGLSLGLPEFKDVSDLVSHGKLFVLGDYFKEKFSTLEQLKSKIPLDSFEKAHAQLLTHFKTHLEKGQISEDIRFSEEYCAVQNLYRRHSIKPASPNLNARPAPSLNSIPRF